MQRSGKYYMVVVVLALVFGLAGCETVKGIGQDIKNTGENISEQFK
jgi:predicted small secreted protein